MNGAQFRAMLKPWILPIAMITGILAHSYISYLAFLTQWLILLMLFITFCRIAPSQIRFNRVMLWLLTVQIAGAIAVYCATVWWSVDVAQGLFICVFCPTATAAPVITAALGGSLPRVVTYSLLSNVTVALLAAPLLSVIGGTDSDMLSTAAGIAIKVFPLIISPLLAAFLLRAFMPKIHAAIGGAQEVSFYLWAVSLIIAVGNSVEFVMAEPPSMIPEIIAIALGAGVVCMLQFIAGRRIGARYGDAVSAAQSLAQKNTVLAIWLALTYLHPVASVAPAAYIAWQNTINSVQLYRYQRHHSK
ncbi:MAG: transporter [Paramuribaculum sp.]|nr:transporter [Paramuribaculum sp.]